jgi:Undecaprenyl-phosphate glucose phosphotransferase
MSDGVHAVAHVSSSDSSARKLALPFDLVEPSVAAVDVVVVITASVFAGVGYHWFFLNYVPNVIPYVLIGALASLNFATNVIALGSYRFDALVNFRRQVCHITLAWVGVFLILFGVAFSLKMGETLSRGATFGFLALGLLFLLVWRGVLTRLLINSLANGAFAKQKTILIGEGTLLSGSKALREMRRYGYTPSAVFDIGEFEGSASPSDGLLDTLNSVIRVAREEAIENVLLFISWDRSNCLDIILNTLSVLPVRVHLVPDDKVVGYLTRTWNIGPVWTAELKRAPLSKIERGLKRAVDVFGAFTGLLVLSPLMVAVAILIKVDSRGPILFTQWRSGFNGRLFRIFKFRTMTVLEDGSVIRQAAREDPRFTRLGRWLRRTSIDELPQLCNVLRGEMSLVGPRPHAAAHDCEYERRIAAYAFRYQLKPGLTGWAQLKGYRGATGTLDLMSKRIEHDLWYIKNWSFWLDLKILLGTLITEIWRSRAY